MESHMLCVRVSEEDYKTIQRMAREQHWSMNVFLKNLILENLNGVEQSEKSLWKEKEMGICRSTLNVPLIIFCSTLLIILDWKLEIW